MKRTKYSCCNGFFHCKDTVTCGSDRTSRSESRTISRFELFPTNSSLLQFRADQEIVRVSLERCGSSAGSDLFFECLSPLWRTCRMQTCFDGSPRVVYEPCSARLSHHSCRSAEHCPPLSGFDLVSVCAWWKSRSRSALDMASNETNV